MWLVPEAVVSVCPPPVKLSALGSWASLMLGLVCPRNPALARTPDYRLTVQTPCEVLPAQYSSSARTLLAWCSRLTSFPAIHAQLGPGASLALMVAAISLSPSQDATLQNPNY